MSIQTTINQQIGTLPEHLQAEILDFVLFLKTRHTAKFFDATDIEQRRQKVGEYLTELAKSKPFADIEDPVAWQRENRKDRPLPGREP